MIVGFVKWSLSVVLFFWVVFIFVFLVVWVGVMLCIIFFFVMNLMLSVFIRLVLFKKWWLLEFKLSVLWKWWILLLRMYCLVFKWLLKVVGNLLKWENKLLLIFFLKFVNVFWIWRMLKKVLCCLLRGERLSLGGVKFDNELDFV